MGDAENNQPSKKRAAGIQLSRDNPGFDDDDNDESPEGQQVAGTFKRASEDVLATRRIVKVRRNQTSSNAATSAPSNPFTDIRLVPTPPPVEVVQPSSAKSNETEFISENKVDKSKDEPSAVKENDENPKQSEVEVGDTKTELSAETGDKTEEANEQNKTEPVILEGTEAKNSADGATPDAKSDLSQKEANEEEEKNKGETSTDKNANSASFSSFQNLSSGQTAFSGITGTGFSSTSFSFESVPKDGSGSSSTGGSLFGGLTRSTPTFNFGGCSDSNNGGTSSIFGTSAANIVSKSVESKIPPMQEVPIETGEENEKAVFTADSVMFEFMDGLWKERGKGELKVNVSTTGDGKARLVMRARGNYRLILNASLFPEMKLTNMEKKGITFVCVNSASEGKGGLSTIALKFKDPSIVEEFRAVVMEHKDKAAPVSSKTPENSPKASDE